MDTNTLIAILVVGLLGIAFYGFSSMKQLATAQPNVPVKGDADFVAKFISTSDWKTTGTITSDNKVTLDKWTNAIQPGQVAYRDVYLEMQVSDGSSNTAYIDGFKVFKITQATDDNFTKQIRIVEADTYDFDTGTKDPYGLDKIFATPTKNIEKTNIADKIESGADFVLHLRFEFYQPSPALDSNYSEPIYNVKIVGDTASSTNTFNGEIDGVYEVQ